MPSPVTAYRVFIASPGGLEDERESFRATLNRHNETDAIERGVIFLPIGWELTPGGVGRPQQIINEEVRRCDFFVLVLHETWGSAPQRDPGGFTSGSEEELDVARRCYDGGTMREIVVLFKDVDTGKQKDPGPQLQKVLDFRKQLEREKALLFETFDESRAFEQRLLRHLTRWVRIHEEEAGGARQPPPAVAPPPEGADLSLAAGAGSATVQNAARLASAGRFTDAEQTFATVITLDPDGPATEEQLEALAGYGELLLHKGSHSRAENVFARLREIARAGEQHQWEAVALDNLAAVRHAAGESEQAEADFREAVDLRVARLGAKHPDVAGALNRLAKFLSAELRFEEAERAFLKALEIQGVQVA